MPDIVSIPNSLLIALAPAIKRKLNVPIVCTLQGEDCFLDGLGDPYRDEALRLIREHAASVDAFLAVSRFGADRMSEFLGIERSRIHIVPIGIDFEGHTRARLDVEPFTIGYLARVAPEKGLHVLCEVYRRLRARPGCPPSRLVAAGYLAPEHKGYLADIEKKMAAWGLADQFEYRGALDRAEKIAFLQDAERPLRPLAPADPEGSVPARGDGERRARRAAAHRRVHRSGGDDGRRDPRR